MPCPATYSTSVSLPAVWHPSSRLVSVGMASEVCRSPSFDGRPMRRHAGECLHVLFHEADGRSSQDVIIHDGEIGEVDRGKKNPLDNQPDEQRQQPQAQHGKQDPRVSSGPTESVGFSRSGLARTAEEPKNRQGQP